MAREPLLIIDCSDRSENTADILRLMNGIGWHLRDGELQYLPPDDNDNYDWQYGSLTPDELYSIAEQKQRKGEIVGAKLYYKDTGTGITVLAKSTREILISPDINRITIDGSSGSDTDFTDISFYIRTLLIPLKKAGCLLEKTEYSEIMG